MIIPSPIYGGLPFSFHTICKKKIKLVHKIIKNKLHKHSFFITTFDMVFDLHYARLKSYVGLGVNAWLFVRLVILVFCMAFNIFSFTLHTKLGLPHALDLKLTNCICGQPLNLAKTHLLCCFLGGEHPTMLFGMHLFHHEICRVLCEQIHVLLPPSLQYSPMS